MRAASVWRPRGVYGHALLAAAAIGVLAAPLVPAAEPKGRRYAVVAIGDSLTDPRSGGGRYLTELGRRCPQSRFTPYGIGGQRTDHMRWRFAEDVVLRPRARGVMPTHVIILAGVNDVLAGGIRHAPITRIQKNLQSMYRTGSKHGIQVVALTVPPWGRLAGVTDARAKATDDLNAWLLAHPDVDHAIDIRPTLSCGDRRVLCPTLRRFPNDLVHWNHAGHRAVADVLHARVFADCL